MVHYLLANAEWKGGLENQKRAMDPTFSPSLHPIIKVVVPKNEPVLYYLSGKHSSSRVFVREEFLHVNTDMLQLPPQSILSENQCTRLVHFICITNNKFDKVQQYAKKHDGTCIMKTGWINDVNIYLWLCENGHHLWEAPYMVLKQKFEWCPLCNHSQNEH